MSQLMRQLNFPQQQSNCAAQSRNDSNHLHCTNSRNNSTCFCPVHRTAAAAVATKVRKVSQSHAANVNPLSILYGKFSNWATLHTLAIPVIIIILLKLSQGLSALSLAHSLIRETNPMIILTRYIMHFAQFMWHSMQNRWTSGRDGMWKRGTKPMFGGARGGGGQTDERERTSKTMKLCISISTRFHHSIGWWDYLLRCISFSLSLKREPNRYEAKVPDGNRCINYR